MSDFAVAIFAIVVVVSIAIDIVVQRKLQQTIAAFLDYCRKSQRNSEKMCSDWIDRDMERNDAERPDAL
jgi:hypothetical protein